MMIFSLTFLQICFNYLLWIFNLTTNFGNLEKSSIFLDLNNCQLQSLCKLFICEFRIRDVPLPQFARLLRRILNTAFSVLADTEYGFDATLLSADLIPIADLIPSLKFLKLCQNFPLYFIYFIWWINQHFCHLQ